MDNPSIKETSIFNNTILSRQPRLRHLNDEKAEQSENVQEFFLHLCKILGGPEELVPPCVETAARILSAMTAQEKVEALEQIIEDTVATR